MQSVTRDGFRFDTGPSLLLFPDTYRETFAALGADIADFVDIQPVQEAAYRVHFADGTSADLFYDVRDMCRQMNSIEPGAGRAYLRWLASARTALELGTKNFIERDFDGWGDLLQLNKLLPLAAQVNMLDMLAPHHWRLGQRFKSEKLRALFSLQDLYVGLTPYNSPSVFSLLAATEITDGVWYPVGGFQKVHEALSELARRHGARIVTGAEVTRVECSEGRVRSVRCSNGSVYAAGTVLCNADVATALGLVDTEDGAQRAKVVADKAYSASVISYNWSVARELPALRHHNVFLSGEWRKSWDRAADASGLCARPNFYVHNPRQTDPSAAPAGSESIMVLLPVANLQERARRRGSAAAARGAPDGAAASKELVDAGREAVLRAFRDSGIGDISGDIVGEFVVTPEEWAERYGVQHGAVFGLSHGLDQLAVLRPAIRDEDVAGLYFTGASTRPGNGVPLCMISGRLAAERILREQGTV